MFGPILEAAREAGQAAGRASSRLVIAVGLGMVLLAMLACGASTPTTTPAARNTRPPATAGTRAIPTLVPTYTRMPSWTPTQTPTPTNTRTATPTRTSTPIPTATRIPTVVSERPAAPTGTKPAVSASVPPAVPVEPACPEPAGRTDLRGKVIFWTDRDGTDQRPRERVYVMDADGSGQQALGPTEMCAQKAHEYFQERLAISNDSQWRLHVERLGAGTSIYLRDAKAAFVRRVTTLDGYNYDPAWAPDQARIAFVSQVDQNDEIYLADINGTWSRRLTFNTWEWDKHPSWSVDGQQIVFWSNRETARKQIWVMKADGTQQHNVSNNGFNDWDPIWVNP